MSLTASIVIDRNEPKPFMVVITYGGAAHFAGRYMTGREASKRVASLTRAGNELVALLKQKDSK